MWKYLRSKRTVYSTLTILALFAAVYYSPGNIEIFDPIKNAISDFDFTDVVFYSFRNGDTAIDTNIVIINIGNLRRAELAEKIRLINAFEPKVIGLDANFKSERTPEQDTPLVNALREAKSIVLAAQAKGQSDEDNPYLRDTLINSHPKFFSPNVTYGHDDLLLDDQNSKATTVRKIAPQLSIRGSESKPVPAFAVKIAEKFNPALVERILKRGNEAERINYRGYASKNFITLDVDQITPENLAIVRGKAVLMGFMGATFEDVNNNEDKKWSPMSRDLSKSLPDMHGVVVHANFLSTIIRGDFIDEMSDWVATVLGIVVCFLNVALFFYVEEKAPEFFGGIIKLLQFIEAVTLMFASILLMYNFDYIFGFGLMLGVIILAPDLYELYESSYRFLKTKLRNAPRIPLDKLQQPHGAHQR